MDTNEMIYKILVVDDEPANLRLLERLFSSEYQVITALSGKEGLEILAQHEVALIISDQRMPGMTGIEFLKQAGEMRQHTVRIILTGYTDVNDLVQAINYGFIYKYVTKPWVNADLKQTVVRGLEHYEMKKGRNNLALQNERLSALLKTTENELINLVSEVLYSTNKRVYGHARRTRMYATAIGRRFNLSDVELEQLKLSAFFHDLGIPQNNQLTIDSEGNEITRITEFYRERSANRLAQVPFLNPIAVAVNHLQENFDKSGYPNGLGDEQIPLYSRIIAIAGLYDQMTENFNTDGQSSHDKAIEKLKDYSGSILDPMIVATFCEIKSIGQIRNFIEQEVSGISKLNPGMGDNPNNLTLPTILQEIKTNPLLAFEVLRLANTLDNDSNTPNLLTAMTKLGEDKLRLLLERNGLLLCDASLVKNWEEDSIRCAVLMQLLAAHTELMNSDEAYTLGLLQDLGKVLLMKLFPNKMNEINCQYKISEIKENERDKSPNREIEFFGIDSAQISEWMISVCGLNDDLTSAISSQNSSNEIISPVSLLLNIARQIARTDENEVGTVIDSLGQGIFTLLRLNRDEMKLIAERATNISSKIIKQKQSPFDHQLTTG